MTPKYTYLYLQETLIFPLNNLVTVSVISLSGWQTIDLGSMQTKQIYISTSRQCSKLTHFFPTNILSHSITPSDTVRNLGVTFDSYFNFRKHFYVKCLLFVTFAVFVTIFLFQSPKLLLHHSLLIGLITATLFFITSHLRIF